MKIISIHIGNFGGLKNFELIFEDGFQTIYGENEFGKSTIMAFIKMMFFGKTSKSKDLNQNLRKKYQPFDRSPMSGNIVFEVNDHTYLVEKEFGRTSAGDVTRIYDMTVSKEVQLTKEEEVLTHFLGIDEATFDRTIFSGNVEVFAGKNVNDTILAKIANLSTGIEESTDVSGILNELQQEAQKLKSIRGNAGKIPQVSDKINELTQEKSRLTQEKSNLMRQGTTDRAFVQREINVIDHLIQQMEEANELYKIQNSKKQPVNNVKKRSYKASGVFFIMAVILALAGYFIDYRICALSLVFFVCNILQIKSTYNHNHSEDSPDFDRTELDGLINRIKVMKEEMGFEGCSISDLKRKKQSLCSKQGNVGVGIIDQISERINQCDEEIKRQNALRCDMIEQYESYQIAYKVMQDTINEMHGSVSKELNIRCGEIFSYLTCGKYDMFMITKDNNIMVRKKGNPIMQDGKTLSTAIIGQAYLSLRIAICELLTLQSENGNNLPIIMDDVLSYYDDSRVNVTLELLKSLGNQVILFTCHNYNI